MSDDGRGMTLVHGRSPSFFPVFARKEDGDPHQTHYCPGCGHGIVTKLLAEAIDSLGIQDRTILVGPVGCSVFGYEYVDTGNVQAAHGRAPAVATGIKRSRPDAIVVCYQGDGDLAAIGTAEIIHAANRGEAITVIFVNNAIYGMTGGQMAPTTLVGERSTTTPTGRDPALHGYPLRVSELLATLEAPVYLERVALGSNKQIMAAGRALRRALRSQVEGRGFSLVEVLSPCPTIWGMEPVEAQGWVRETMTRTFPLGTVRDRTAVPAPLLAAGPQVAPEELPRILGITRPEASRPPEGTPIGARAEPRGGDHRILIAGFGGQGVLTLGALLAEAGLAAGFHASWLPSYGPQMRSGTSNCHVRLSAAPVDCPVVSRPTALIALNEPSLRRFLPQVQPHGLVLYNADEVPGGLAWNGVRMAAIPATAIADRLGSARAGNAVMLGALLEATGVLSEEVMERTMRRLIGKRSWYDLDVAALEAGRVAARRVLPATCVGR